MAGREDIDGFELDLRVLDEPDQFHYRYDEDLNEHPTKYTTRQMRERNRLTLPKVLKNDIKRYFSRMFMNTINSANILEVQNFCATFMTSPCKFVGQSELSAQFNFPSTMKTYGPCLTSHYLLGVFLMFPDMVMHLTDTKIVTSKSWAGSRIELSLDMAGTKVRDVPMHVWLPEESAFEASAVDSSSEGSDKTAVPSSNDYPLSKAKIEPPRRRNSERHSL